MLNLHSTDDLPLVLCELGKNKKKADDTWILQAAINQPATTPACIANEFTKPQLSTHIVDKSHSYIWAATGDEITNGITLFNIVFMLELGGSFHGHETGLPQSSGSGGDCHELL